MNDAATPRCDVDCEAGRRLGCASFCCRLLVRLDDDERTPTSDGSPAKGFVDKDPISGLCMHFDASTHLCKTWATRPRVCRQYSCNEDPLLQVVLVRGFTTLKNLVQASESVQLPKAQRRQIPYLSDNASTP